MDSSKTVTLTLQAENDVQGWLNTKTPYLFIRCKEHKTDVAVYTGMAASVEQGADYSLNHHTARLRFDKGRPVTQSWVESTSNDALFAPSPIGLSRQIEKASTFRFQFTPFNANPQVVTFDVRGLSKFLPDVAGACGWKQIEAAAAQARRARQAERACAARGDETSGYGWLKVFSDPPGGTVFVDGKPQGTAPMRQWYTDGIHRAHVTMPGYTEWSSSVCLPGGKETVVRAKLKPIKH